MATNTQKRILSGLAIILLIAFVTYLGQEFSQLFAFLFWGILINDEIIKNFLKIDRDKNEYKLSVVLYLILVTLFFSFESTGFSKFLVFLNIVQNVYLLFFLFKMRSKTLSIFRNLKGQEYLTCLFVFLPVHSVAYAMNFENWVKIFFGLVLLVSATDAFAWAVGKNFGKRKLWPAVSPKKTVEGAMGALILAPLLMMLYWKFVLGVTHWWYYFIFIVLCIATIIGDLIQSKLKRRFSLKDSSTLIPGHGGVYDRSDSLLFVAPFYALFVASVMP